MQICLTTTNSHILVGIGVDGRPVFFSEEGRALRIHHILQVLLGDGVVVDGAVRMRAGAVGVPEVYVEPEVVLTLTPQTSPHHLKKHMLARNKHHDRYLPVNIPVCRVHQVSQANLSAILNYALITKILRLPIWKRVRHADLPKRNDHVRILLEFLVGIAQDLLVVLLVLGIDECLSLCLFFGLPRNIN